MGDGNTQKTCTLIMGGGALVAWAESAWSTSGVRWVNAAMVALIAALEVAAC